MYSSTGGLKFYSQTSTGFFVNKPAGDGFSKGLLDAGAVEIEDQLYETLRIESGVPKYGVDIDETTVVPETGSEEMISYSKGCYIGQEIIARIHFRGHVAKQLTGLQAESSASADGFFSGAELTSPEGKNAGRITSVTYSPKLERLIALAYVRYDYLADGTELLTGEMPVRVTDLPFVD
jgi:folate-binding protein YgfZ